MRVSHLTLDLSVEDLNELLRDIAPDVKISLTTINEAGIHGQVRLLWWNVDFVAKPACSDDGEVSVAITASKLMPIPSAIVERGLREAVKDAPPGIDVIQQCLRVYLPSLLSPLGISILVRQLQTHDGFVRIALAQVKLPPPEKFAALAAARA